MPTEAETSSGATPSRRASARPKLTRRFLAIFAIGLMLVVVDSVLAIVQSLHLFDLMIFTVGLGAGLLGAWYLAVGRGLRRWGGVLLALLAVTLLALNLYKLVTDVTWIAVFGLVAALALFSVCMRLLRMQAAPMGEDGTHDTVQLSHPFLIVNPRSGDGRAARADLARIAREQGIDVHELQPGDDIAELARAAVARGADALGIASGDGTVGVVAEVALDADVPLVHVPAGTRCHFGIDLGLNREDLVGALDAFRGVERRIDVVMVADRVCVNNASFGWYADMVHRPEYRGKKVETALDVLSAANDGVIQPDAMRFRAPDGHMIGQVHLLLICNGEYESATLADFGRRLRLDEGKMQVTCLEYRPDVPLTRFAVGAMLTTLHASDGFYQWDAAMLHVEGDGPILSGIDGEAIVLPSSFDIVKVPKALRVLVPPGTPMALAPKEPLFSKASFRRIADGLRGE